MIESIQSCVMHIQLTIHTYTAKISYRMNLIEPVLSLFLGCWGGLSVGLCDAGHAYIYTVGASCLDEIFTQLLISSFTPLVLIPGLFHHLTYNNGIEAMGSE